MNDLNKAAHERAPLPGVFETQMEVAPAPANRAAPPPNPMAQVRGGLKALEDEFAKVLPKHITPDKFTRIVMTTLQDKPDLLMLDRQSLFSACMAAAQDGLMVDGKEAALVPFKNRVKYSPMVWGIMKKVRQSGDLSTLTVNMVFEKDKFRYWVDDDGEHVEHEPTPFSDRGTKVGGYAMMKFSDGGRQIEIMSMRQIKDVQDVSTARNGPWQGAFKEEMEKKSIVRRLAKKCPMSPELELVVTRDDDMYDFKRDPRASGLAGELNGTKEGSEPPAGDKIGSLSDLRESPGGSLPRENVGGNEVGASGEHSSDVSGSSRAPAPEGVAVVPGERAEDRPAPEEAGMVMERRRPKARHVPPAVRPAPCR